MAREAGGDNRKARSCPCYHACMNASDPSRPQEVSRDPVEIRDEDSIIINDALAIASDLSFSLGKSTLQRWAKFWWDNPGGAVRCVLVTTRAGNVYKLSRQDFEAWVFDQKQNDESRQTPRDPERPRKVLQDPERPPEASPETQANGSRIKDLENENMQLKIDVGVRKQLLERAKEEMDGLRSMSNNLLRENGALQYQIHQLAPPAPKREVGAESAPVDNSTQPTDTPAL
jgi:hypothetical protein